MHNQREFGHQRRQEAMKPTIVFQHKFVESLPDVLEEKTLCVCMEFATAAHKCACVCGREVVTPFSPTDWKVIYDGKTVTLDPSIGNWSFPCRSHYWIRRDRVEWAPAWSDEEIKMGHMRDRRAKEIYFGSVEDSAQGETSDDSALVAADGSTNRFGIWRKLLKWLQGS